MASGTLEEDLEFHIYFLSYYISVPIGVIFQKERWRLGVVGVMKL